MNGIEVLLEEHDNIEEFNKVVRKISLGLLKGEKIDVEDLRISVDFIKEYADRIHHGKEEDILFIDIENELGQLGKNLVSHGMLVEHDLARYYVSEMEKSIDRYEKNISDDTRLDLITYLMAYRDLLERHIYKENEVVYKYAVDNLEKDTLVRIDEKTLDFESDIKNKESKERYLNILESLKEKYSV